jgi:6-pyruvoyltetrahydropterin/6-carboxytetrahydropterin synthase
VPRFRVCKTFTVESGHMLSKHAERCRFPHGHTRHVEVVVSREELDEQDMVVDFKALKLAIEGEIERFDHAMAVNSNDPLLADMRRVHPESVVVFPDIDPTTEVIAKHLFDAIRTVLAGGFVQGHYRIEPGVVRLERVRVGETPTSWAEYGD